MQMVRICVCHKYADVRHMDMFSLCNFLSFPAKIRFLVVPDLLQPPARHPPGNTACCVVNASLATGYCVRTLPCDPARRGRKDRFAYSLTVVHFRKVVNRQKIGSHENSHPVIRFRFYKLGCNYFLLKSHYEKDE